MQAIITDSSCILDYIVLVGPHMPIMQFVTYHVQKVKNVALQSVAKLQISQRPSIYSMIDFPGAPRIDSLSASEDKKHTCSLTFDNGHCLEFEVTELENGKFHASSGRGWKPNE